MLMIKLVDARKALYEKCVELFHNERVAESIYMYLCDGLEECDVVKPERRLGRWIVDLENHTYRCSQCGKTIITNNDYIKEHKFCFGCGCAIDWSDADMRGEQDGC